MSYHEFCKFHSMRARARADKPEPVPSERLREGMSSKEIEKAFETEKKRGFSTVECEGVNPAPEGCICFRCQLYQSSRFWPKQETRQAEGNPRSDLATDSGSLKEGKK